MNLKCFVNYGYAILGSLMKFKFNNNNNYTLFLLLKFKIKIHIFIFKESYLDFSKNIKIYKEFEIFLSIFLCLRK